MFKYVGLLLWVIIVSTITLNVINNDKVKAFSFDLGGYNPNCTLVYQFSNPEPAITSINNDPNGQTEWEALVGIDFTTNSGLTNLPSINMQCNDPNGSSAFGDWGTLYLASPNTFKGAIREDFTIAARPYTNAYMLGVVTVVVDPTDPRKATVSLTANPNNNLIVINNSPLDLGADTINITAYPDVVASLYPAFDPTAPVPGGNGSTGPSLPNKFIDVTRIQFNRETYTDGGWDSIHKYYLSSVPAGSAREPLVNADANCKPYIEVDWSINLNKGPNLYADDITNDYTNLNGSTDIKYHDVTTCNAPSRTGDPITLDTTDANIFFGYSKLDKTLYTLWGGGGINENFYIGAYNTQPSTNSDTNLYLKPDSYNSSPFVAFTSDPNNMTINQTVNVAFTMDTNGDLHGTTNILRVLIQNQVTQVIDQNNKTTINGAAETCESSINGVGWIFCPVANFLLEGLQKVGEDGLIKNVLDFDALDSTNDSNQIDALNSIWAGFRTIANVGFVIAFLIVVYSAATGGLMSAYDVKKLLPKLFIGAILVQLSFFISIQLVELFNALGRGVIELMLAPINTPAAGGTSSIYDSSSIQFSVFSGVLNTAVSVLFILLIIVGAALSFVGIFMMLIVFILRNMAIMVLTVVSPIAFVAWILPNTEKIFKKWWSTYIQLLALYPIAMAFLASGRLVSYIWTHGNTSWGNQWIGMVAMFAPYLMAPKMFSFAGSAVNGIVKGVDGAKNSLRQNIGKTANSRMGKGILGSASSRFNKRFGVGNDHNRGSAGLKGSLGRAMERAAKTGTLSRATAKGVSKKTELEREDASTASVLQVNATAGITQDERKQYRRNVVAQGTEAQQIASLEGMLINNDIHGIEQALENKQISANTFAQFLDKDGGKNASALHQKARHLTTGAFEGDEFVRGQASLSGVTADVFAASRPETIRQTLADLNNQVASATNPAEIAAANTKLDSFLEFYRDDVYGNQRVESQLDPKIRSEMEAAVESRAGVATPQQQQTIASVDYTHYDPSHDRNRQAPIANTDIQGVSHAERINENAARVQNGQQPLPSVPDLNIPQSNGFNPLPPRP